MARNILEMRGGVALPSGTKGQSPGDVVAAAGSAPSAQSAIVDEIKRQLQSEMGLFPVRLLRERKESFVELNAYDNIGKTNYGTAGYLGSGYFITVKHGVIALDKPRGRAGGAPHHVDQGPLQGQGRDRPRHGFRQRERRSASRRLGHHPGQSELDLPPLRVDTSYAYDFAEPIFRLGNDYSKGIILSTGYVGQKTTNGLVTCLTDGHPGCPAAAC